MTFRETRRIFRLKVKSIPDWFWNVVAVIVIIAFFYVAAYWIAEERAERKRKVYEVNLRK